LSITKYLLRATLFTFVGCAVSLAAQNRVEWTTPFPPFRIAGNLYYVGSQDLASYLIATPRGLILINSSFEASVPLIRKSVESLGFRFSDIKILLISHAHSDHCAGSAQIIHLTGAKYYVMDGDVSVVESGGRTDFQYGAQESQRYPPAHVDRVLHDGDTVQLGGTVLTAHLTPGHTRGTTTWTLDEPEGSRFLHVVIVGSPNVNPGYKLVGNKAYPQIAQDYKRGFASARHTAVRRISRCARLLLRSRWQISALEKPATRTPSSTPPDTRPTSPIASRHLRRNFSGSRRLSTKLSDHPLRQRRCRPRHCHTTQ
jgi:metallo-beta-lactamase class B